MSSPDDVRAEKLGKYGAYLLPEPTQQCGYIMAIMAMIMLTGGATLETLSFAKLYGEYGSPYAGVDTYSFIAFAGYWCGLPIMLSAILTIQGASHPSNNMVRAVAMASILTILFGVVAIAIPASKWANVDEINAQCSKCSAGQMMFAAYGVIMSCSAIAVFAAILLGILTTQTILAGRRMDSPLRVDLSETMMQPIQSTPVKSDIEMANNTDNVQFTF